MRPIGAPDLTVIRSDRYGQSDRAVAIGALMATGL
jgi:hypothetical protein